jgi:histidinol-phosphate aminotransferase
MSKYWSSPTKNIKPYIPGEQPQDGGYIKLNTNENPYSPSPRVIETIVRTAGEKLRLYPEIDGKSLRRVIADYYGLDAEQVFVGNGSDELLAFAFRAFYEKGTPVIFPDVTYTFYPVYCGLFDIEYRQIPLEENFTLNVDRFKGEGGAVLSNPNAPTGICLGLDDVRKILSQNRDKVVVLDEAYIDFGGDSAVCLVNDFDNLLVVQTASKGRSLAGLRIGWAMGQKDLIEGLARIKDSFNSYTVNTISLAAAIASFGDDEYFRDVVSRVIRTREHVTGEMRKMGFTVCESKANFIFASHPERNAGSLFAALREKKILVRYFDRPRINNHLRITIGTDEQMERLLEVMYTLV